MPQTDLHRAVAAHKDLVERIKAAFPEETEENLADSIEGESQLDTAILSVLRLAIEREAFADAVGGMIETLSARQQRLVDGAQRLRRAARDAMIEGGMPKLTAPDMTVGVHGGKPKVVITDPAAVPDCFCRLKREPDKAAIKEILMSGHSMPGAELGNAEPVLTLRRT